MKKRVSDVLTFEEKQEIIDAFPELTKKAVSMKRLNYHFEESLYEKTIVVQYLHPNGNGFVYLADVPGYETDDRGLVNIREATAEEIRTMIADSIEALRQEVEPEEAVEEAWTNGESTLLLKEEEGFWNVYHDDNLEDSFGEYEEAISYLKEEGFSFEREEK